MKLDPKSFKDFIKLKLSTGLSNPAHSEGQIFYDDREKAPSYHNDEADVTLNIGQEQWIRVKNATGAAILNGKAVYFNGFDGTSGLPTIALAKADAVATSRCVGITTHDIEDGTIGYVTNFGVIHDIDTSSFTAGALLFLSASAAGGLTNTAPVAPYFIVPVGVVRKSDVTTGSILVVLLSTASAINTRVDKQSASAVDSNNTISGTYVDVPNMTLTTKNLGENADYHIAFSCSFSCSPATGIVSFIITVDGVDIAASEKNLDAVTSGEMVSASLLSASLNLASGKIIKLRWKTSTGTATITGRTLLINGTAVSNTAP